MSLAKRWHGRHFTNKLRCGPWIMFRPAADSQDSLPTEMIRQPVGGGS